MSVSLRLRPRLEFDVPGKAEELAQKIPDATEVYQVTVVVNYVVITFPKDQQHFWSPQLQVTLEDKEDKVRVNGLVTPMPAVWTMFAGIYALITVLGFFGSVYGLAQWQLGNSAMPLLVAPISLLLLAGVYVAAQFGQRIGHDQMDALIRFLHYALEPKDR